MNQLCSAANLTFLSLLFDSKVFKKDRPTIAVPIYAAHQTQEESEKDKIIIQGQIKNNPQDSGIYAPFYNFNYEKTHLKQVFSDITCTEFSTIVDCHASDFRCSVGSNGGLNFRDLSNGGDSRCIVEPNGAVTCD